MLVFLALGNAKVLSFALADAKVPNASGSDFLEMYNWYFGYLDDLNTVQGYYN